MNVRQDHHSVFGPTVVVEGVDRSQATVSLHGGHLISWVPNDGRERLFLSSRANSIGAIRGGVPVCFPQFAGLGELPKHGYARTARWRHRDGGRFVLDVNPSMWPGWAHACSMLFEVTLGPATLTLSLSIDNVGPTSLSFTGALHTYLYVTDVESVSIDGLGGARIHENEPTVPGAIVFDGEVDLALIDVSRPAIVRVVGEEHFLVTQTGFADTVVWNVGAEKAITMADLGAGEWRNYVCVEAAVVDVPITVEPGSRWVGTQTVIALDGSNSGGRNGSSR